MACLEECDCGGKKGCYICGGKGVNVVDAMEWGAKRGYGPYIPKSDRKSNNRSEPKNKSIISRLGSFFRRD
jgi:hypothetical protein